ncbi:hypothetical protein AMIS_2360 [Actinoplanes missouriensis 431]|uniref:Uncharacterized protein n=1 Tax=Actinoplanes missouriensis (strain ATCC 14538 / DSM 43046 / CBS 188.64 / JCM 3121 / NBRC 102363 / NCIMB 12654 / NRRL B-3342 / UNCC 431) TaxID=512565 RepID=I0GXG9_ACTM4|nr:hypothetical protein [Actinoplanes missouriensis]BAL85456.1 hypothetical protein AMIS_2360 [Actinoplanes missouriensis 431]
MADWMLVPCLVKLRDEFNSVAPRRDKGADGAIGDSSHTSSSDHTPDEDSDVLRDHDADDKNEVHAVDVDSDGPWPDGSGREAGGWFDRRIQHIAAQERIEYASPDVYGRLQYIIWRGRIISRSWGWSEWRTYSGASKHFDHAHISARYLTRTESDTRPWGVEEDDVTPEQLRAAVKAELKDALPDFAKAVGDLKVNVNPGTGKTPNWQRWSNVDAYGSPERARILAAIGALAKQVAALGGKDLVDEDAIVDAVLAGLTPERIAAGIPDGIAQDVVDALGERLAAA